MPFLAADHAMFRAWTLKSVIKLQQLAPAGEFDVYDQSGKVISNEKASQHRDGTVYVGVAKVAGEQIQPGFDLDDDDDDGWDLDDDQDLVKPREVIFILQDERRISVTPNAVSYTHLTLPTKA